MGVSMHENHRPVFVYRQAEGAGSCGARIGHRVAERVGSRAIAYSSAVNEDGGKRVRRKMSAVPQADRHRADRREIQDEFKDNLWRGRQLPR